MKYYIDLQWYNDYHQNYISYEIPPIKFYDTEEEARKECDYLNNAGLNKDNELYIVCELY